MGLDEDLEFSFNAELTKRLLIRYFCDKGFKENFDERVYPPTIQDITESIPELSGKVELEPYAVEVDPQNGFARLGWNLFILGNQRMYLGETEHTELQELARQLEEKCYVFSESESNTARRTRTARDIITWMVRTLGRSEAGLLRSVPQNTWERPMIGKHPTGEFFERPKPIRPQGTSQY